jgi:hypothetical protein
MDRLSSAAHADFRRWRGRPGEPRALPAREFDSDFRNDSCSGCARRRGCVRQSLTNGGDPNSCGSPRAGRNRGLSVVYRLEGPFSLRAVDWGEARKLLGYGGWMFATNVLYPALASADQFIIGSVMGVASVAHYAVPMNPVQRSAAIPIAFGRTLFPRMSSLSGDAAHALGARALSTMAYGFAAICAPAMILSATFFRYWIGADFSTVAAPVAQVLFPGMWMGALSLVGFTPPAKSRQGRRDRQIEYRRISAVCGHSLGVD